jgi:ABC-2 type transport system permease protein
MIDLLKTELYKIFTKPRTFIGFGAIFIIVAAVHLGFYFEGQDLLDFVIQNIKDKFILEGSLINTYTVSYVILNSLWVHLPILVSLVTGDLIAGEANSGTLRLILTRPVSRTKLLTAKFIAGWIYALLLVLIMISSSLFLGYILYGTGDLIVIQQQIYIFSADDSLWRFFGAAAYGVVTMTTVASLSFLLSAFTDNSVGPIIGTFAIIIGITVISTIGYVIIEPVLPYLFTTYMPSWGLFFQMDVDYEKIAYAFRVQIIYSIIFLVITIFYFRKKDILS